MRVLIPRRVRVLITGMMLAAMAPIAQAQPFGVELDLDGTLGNGPDTAFVSVGALVGVDIWVSGPASLYHVQVMVCDASLQLHEFGIQSFPPPLWSADFIMTLCPVISLTDNTTSVPMILPAKIGTITWEAVSEHPYAELSVEPASSGWFDTSFQWGSFSTSIGAGVVVGLTGTESSDWGAIKGLFR